MRTSTRRVRDEPTRSNSPVSSTRSSFGLQVRAARWRSRRGTACRRRPARSGPTRSVFASVNAPFTWPNSSLSNTPSDRPPALTVTSGLAGAAGHGVQRLRDGALAGAVLAGDEHVGVRRPDARDQLAAPAASPRDFGDEHAAAPSRLERRGSRPRAAGCAAAPAPSSTCVRTIASSRALSHGFWTKSRAPRRIASTATSTLPHAVITTTGSVASSALQLREQVEPFLRPTSCRARS